MSEDISLLPKEVEKKKEQEARQRLLQKVSLVFLAVSLLLGGGAFVYSLVLRNQLSSLEKDVSSEESKIGSLAEVALEAQDLSERSVALSNVFKDKVYFSTLLTTLSQAVPADVTLKEMTVPAAETISVSGTSRSYVSLAKFLLNLKETQPPLAGFEAVDLRSVSSDQQTGEANFDLNLKIVKGGLGQ